MKRLFITLTGIIGFILLFLYVIAEGWMAETWWPAEPVDTARSLPSADNDILFGDLHSHSTFSVDAFLMSLEDAGGDGLHPVSDACDFARHCSGLDFWSINDHGISMNRDRWLNTIDEIRQCNAVTDPQNPDMVAFLGWEWSQAGVYSDGHYGHRNVIVKGLADENIPARTIAALPAENTRAAILTDRPFPLVGAAALAAGKSGLKLATFLSEFRGMDQCRTGVPVRELPDDCLEAVATPRALFDKLRDWNMDFLVIPHGTTWGMYTPPGSSWDKQLGEGHHDPALQPVIELFSGHGNSEQYKHFTNMVADSEGSPRCPQPHNGFVPGCWRAGEIIYERCINDRRSARECNALAAEARRNFWLAPMNMGDKTVPGATPEDWLDAGQCPDCWLPAFNYRPRSSVQYILALRRFGADEGPDRFRFGFIAASDNHSARPGTGYKETSRRLMTESRFDRLPDMTLPPWRPAGKQSTSIRVEQPPETPFRAWNFKRSASWFMTGGLTAVHAEGRTRNDIWEALENRHVYATSGPRIRLWFDMINRPDIMMGDEVSMAEVPRFRVRAEGSFVQSPGCSNEANRALGSNRIEALCRGECYNPTATRRPITRLEVVRIRPQTYPGENIGDLIDDPWKVIPCPGEGDGCSVEFSDPEFVSLARAAVYYVRAIESPSPAIGAAPVTCKRGMAGNCLELVDSCATRPADDDCLSPTEERAWSSPIFVDYGGEATSSMPSAEHRR